MQNVRHGLFLQMNYLGRRHPQFTRANPDGPKYGHRRVHCIGLAWLDAFSRWRLAKLQSGREAFVALPRFLQQATTQAGFRPVSLFFIIMIIIIIIIIIIADSSLIDISRKEIAKPKCLARCANAMRTPWSAF